MTNNCFIVGQWSIVKLQTISGYLFNIARCKLNIRCKEFEQFILFKNDVVIRPLYIFMIKKKKFLRVQVLYIEWRFTRVSECEILMMVMVVGYKSG